MRYKKAEREDQTMMKYMWVLEVMLADKAGMYCGS
jgi:hypothetical protein